jgi:hypothetical protein
MDGSNLGWGGTYGKNRCGGSLGSDEERGGGWIKKKRFPNKSTLLWDNKGRNRFSRTDKMTTNAKYGLAQHLHRIAHVQDAAGDGELLESFINRQNEAAFEILVRRHGPMVLGVCQRILGNYADSEDAFQATFLVLVRKAYTIRPRGMVSNWLYGVARMRRIGISPSSICFSAQSKNWGASKTGGTLLPVGPRTVDGLSVAPWRWTPISSQSVNLESRFTTSMAKAGHSFCSKKAMPF